MIHVDPKETHMYPYKREAKGDLRTEEDDMKKTNTGVRHSEEEGSGPKPRNKSGC